MLSWKQLESLNWLIILYRDILAAFLLKRTFVFFFLLSLLLDESIQVCYHDKED